MSTQVVGEVYEAFARGDVAAVLERLAPDVDWRTPATLPWPGGEFAGHAGVREYLSGFATALESGRVEPDEVLACGGRVVARGVERGRARATGVAFEARFVHVWEVRRGAVQSMHGLVDTAAVRAAFAAGD